MRLVVFMLPVALLLAALALAAQTQNLEFRFQAPAHLVLLYALLFVAGRTIDSGRSAVRWATIGLVLAAAMPPNLAGLGALRLQLGGTWRTYVEAFAPHFGPSMTKDTVIALTEAGAVPYWTEAQVADIVGLNYPPAALAPLTVRDLRKINPDLVFLHQGRSLMNEVLIPSPVEGRRIYAIPPERLRAALRPSRRAVLQRNATSYDDIGLLNVEYAAAVLLEYLSQSTDHDILVVDPSAHRTYVHVWGVKKDWPLREEAMKALQWSLEPDHYRPYLHVRATSAERQ